MTPENTIYKRYEPAVNAPLEPKAEAWWFVFKGNRLLIGMSESKARIPYIKDMHEWGLSPECVQYLGILEGHPCYSAALADDAGAPVNMEFQDMRQLYGLLDEDIYMLAGRAYQIVYWDLTHRFCGKCGSPTETHAEERAKVCPECGFMSYPRLNPAIIVAVVREKQLLLAHAKHFKENFYSVIAGFVEAGETFEECVKREVMEEAGIKVKNIRYFGSQPWPYPNSLMIGFTAEYESGEVKADGVEISDAGWYDASSLPEVPTRMSIAGRLIEWFKASFN